MIDLDQKTDEEKSAYFRQKDDETARYFKSVDFDKIDERVKVISEAFDAKKERLQSCAEKTRFEEAWEEFMAECAKTKTCGISFSNQISAFEKSTGFSFIFIFFCSQWLCNRPKRIAAVRSAIQPKNDEKIETLSLSEMMAP